MQSLPAELSQQILMELGPDGQKILLEGSQLNVSGEVRAAVIEEFLQTNGDPALTASLKGAAGVSASSPYSFNVTTPDRSASAASTPTSGGSRRPFEGLRRVDTKQLLTLVRKEHPQAIALILHYLEGSQASAVLSELSQGVQSEVARRLAEIGPVSQEILQEVEKVLETRLFSLVEGDYTPSDGKEKLLEILNQADRSTEDKIISGLTVKNPQLAGDLKTKLCDFEDLNNIDDPSLQQVLRLTDIRDLCFALKGANKDLSERIYRCLPTEASRALRGDVESLPQPAWDEMKGAQQQIRNILRGLVALGKIKFK
jgi:flagellar motor switch protein FliG